ncbi:PQQ-binding-like beta-propeller repeat protein [Paenibacillus taiwanensis]|uniref:outer membrane protein assembly factor BamB family protein n=1 Tax=Paenibacillus taiwanensis TaxID=401638 RepID=UPI0003F81879|nr:PQQ-binding-like beta-propeller repeat protein [Paenibacillus taiwanensis]
MGKGKWRLYIVFLITIATLVGLENAANAAPESRTSYEGLNYERIEDTSLTTRPLWTAPLDQVSDDLQLSKGIIAIGHGYAYVIQNGKLAALQVQNGKQTWTFGNYLRAPLLYHKGTVYVSSDKGDIYAVDAKNGKKRWVSAKPTTNSRRYIIDRDQLFALNGDIQAYNIKDGKFQWRESYSEQLPVEIVATDELILAQNNVSGAYSYDQLHAFDRKTGKEKWNLGQQLLPFRIEGNTALSVKTATLLDHNSLPTLHTLNLQNGKIINTVQYNPENIAESAESYGYGRGDFWVHDNRLYVGLGSKVYGYPLNTAPSVANQDVYKPDGDENERYAAGPYDGRLYFTTNSRLLGVKLANKSTVYYSGLTNPIARFELIGHGIYVAQTDGILVVIHTQTAKPVLRLATFGKVFGPTLRDEGIILVQTKGKLLAFKEPASVK